MLEDGGEGGVPARHLRAAYHRHLPGTQGVLPHLTEGGVEERGHE